MAIATGTAMLAAGAIGGGASLLGAKKAADASKSAAKIQSASADKVMAANDRVYHDQRQLMNPYVQMGTQAFANMQRMAGGQPMSIGQAMSSPQGGYQAPQPPQGGMSLGSALAPQGGGMVKVASPDGEVREFPQAMAQQLVAKGGRIVS